MMTDKQIIIDGVDVSECRCLAYPELDNPMCNGLYLGCKNNNCEYKKWKRKEQECERLKEANKHIDHNRTQKANKLKRIEEIITACKSGYTDEFIQSILAIILEAEPIKE